MLVLECIKVWKKIVHHVIVSDLSFSLNEGDVLDFTELNGKNTTFIHIKIKLKNAKQCLKNSKEEV